MSERWRNCKSLEGMVSDPLFPDWPLEGPRTTEWLVKEIAKSGGGSTATSSEVEDPVARG